MSWIQNTLVVEVLLLAAMLGAALLHKAGMLPFRISFLVFLACGAVVLLFGVFALVKLVMGGKAWLPHLLISLIPFSFVLSVIVSGGLSAPKIHDVSTRHEPPMVFQKVPEDRTAGDNSLALDTQVIALQTSRYADLQSLVLDSSVEVCFEQAKHLVLSRGWQLLGEHVSNVDSVAWLEAYERSFLFGFKDDVRIEVSASDQGGCLVNMRSASRLGISDLGVNAKRIRAFLSELSRQ